MDFEQLLSDLSDLDEDIETITDIFNSASTVIGYATSFDGKTWTVKNSEVLTESGGEWTFMDSVNTPCVIKDGDTYKMWYTTANSTLTEGDLEDILTDLGDPDTEVISDAIADLLDSFHTAIGYATSNDGANWTIQDPQVFAGTGGEWTLMNSVGSPSVIKDGDTYKMWYTAANTTFTQSDLDDLLDDLGNVGMDELRDILGCSTIVIGYATSGDGLSWTVQEPRVLPADNGLFHSFTDPCVIKSGSTYRMWYTNADTDLLAGIAQDLIDEINTLDIDALFTTLEDEGISGFMEDLLDLDLGTIKGLLDASSTMIGYATSDDGISWTVQKADDLTGSSVYPWSSVAAPTVVRSSNAYEMWYTKGVVDEGGDELPWQGFMDLFLGSDLPVGYASKALESIAVTPATFTVDAGESKQFQATASYADITDNVTDTVTWSSSNTAVASVDTSGLATSYNQGTATITATIGSVSGTATLTVDPAALVSIDVTPADPTVLLGSNQQFRAMGTYSDNTTAEITTSTGVSWASANTSVADIELHTGLATTDGKAAGETLITATDASTGVSDSSTLTATAATLETITVDNVYQATDGDLPSVDAGNTIQLYATGTFDDATKANLTDLVEWSSDNTTVATIVTGGLATSYTSGNTTITATYGGVSDNATLEVTAPVLDSVVVTPVNPTITFVAGDPPTLQFTATAIYTDGSTGNITASALWESNNTDVAENPPNGFVTTKDDGTTVIKAIDTSTGAPIFGESTLTVLADTVAPVVTLTSPTEGLVLNDTDLTVSGSVDDTTAYTRGHTKIIVNGTAIDVNPDPDAATGAFSQGVTLEVGSNTVLIRAVDSSGNTGTSGTITVEVDPAKPAVTITTPAAGVLTSATSCNVTGTVAATITTATLRINGNPYTVTVASGNFSRLVTLSEGTNVIVANAYTTGHEGELAFRGTSGVRTITRDTTAPVVTIDSPASGSVVNTAGVTVSGTVNDPRVASASLTLNGTPQTISVVEGNFSQNVTLVTEDNTILVEATDEAGNTSSVDTSPNSQVTVTLDTAAPAVIITAPDNNLVTNVAGQHVTGTVSDPSATTTLTVGSTEYNVSLAPDGTFSKMVSLTAGANTIEVTATDAASNAGTSGVINVTVDITAPGLTIGLSDPTDSITITVSSNEALQAAPTVTVSPAISPAGTMTKIDVNRWNRTDGSSASPIAANDYTVTVTGTDKAGNTSTKTATFCKETVISDYNAETETYESEVATETTTVEIDTTVDVDGEPVSVTQHASNPAGNVENPEGAPLEAGAFIEIVVSPEIRDNLEQIYITVDYDEDDIAAQGIDESTLRLYLWNVSTGLWQEVNEDMCDTCSSGVDTDNNYIWGYVEHLSKYGGFGSAVEEEEEEEEGRRPSAGPEARPEPGTTNVAYKVIANGQFVTDATAKSDDELCWVTIDKDTIGLDKHGKSLTEITVVHTDEPPSLPAHHNMIGLAYEFGPEGTTFDPPITVTFTYDESLIPAGADEGSLVIAVWNDTTGDWDKLDSTINTAGNTISAEISHFSTLTVLVSTRPATFATGNLSISPAEVDIGETVTISLKVTNTGDLEGTRAVTLKINDVVLETREVTLDSGASQTVTFTTSRDAAGTYTVSVDGLAGTFSVREAVAPPPPPPPQPEPAAFTTSNLVITPAEVNISETVTISLKVTNTGEAEGTYEATLKVNGVVLETREVTLDGGASQTVTFTTSRDAAGTYTVSADGLAGTFSVREAAAPPPPPPTPFNWWLVIGPVIAVVVIVIMLWLVFIRRRE